MAEKMTRTKKRFALALAAVLTLVGAGVAFAYWSSTGTGTGTATTGESTAFIVTSDPTDTEGDIVPGGPGETVAFTVENPEGAGTQSVTGVTVAMATAPNAAWNPPAGCDIADYSATITTPVTGQIADGASAEGTATVSLTNTDENQDACQGAEVPLLFTAN